MSNVKKLVITAMLIALCVVLPMAFHSIQQAGMILLPMHIPVLLAGLTLGWKYGLVTGIVGPFLSSLTGMPPTAIAYLMMLELGVYGLVSGLVVQFIRTKRASLDFYIALVAAMLAGRVVCGIAQVFFIGEYNFMSGSWGGAGTFTWSMWASVYFATALPGLVIQLAFIPSVVMALERERVLPFRYPVKA
jgi:riboflavin transporter FmnP